MALLFPDPAASLPGESEFLRHVADDLTDESRKLVYADWLDDHDDPRGKFLRDFVEARQAGRPLIQDESLAPSWRHVTGIELERSLVEHDLVEYRRAILTLARPAIELDCEEAEEEPELGTSRIGGRPDVPLDFQWPYPRGADFRHVPYSFVAQIRLEDLRNTVVVDMLPKQGLLAIFSFPHLSYPDTSHFIFERRPYFRLDIPSFEPELIPPGEEINIPITSCKMTAWERLHKADSVWYPYLAQTRPDIISAELAYKLCDDKEARINHYNMGEDYESHRFFDSRRTHELGQLFGTMSTSCGEMPDQHPWPQWIHFHTIHNWPEFGFPEGGDCVYISTWITRENLRVGKFQDTDTFRG